MSNRKHQLSNSALGVFNAMNTSLGVVNANAMMNANANANKEASGVCAHLGTTPTLSLPSPNIYKYRYRTEGTSFSLKMSNCQHQLSNSSLEAAMMNANANNALHHLHALNKHELINLIINNNNNFKPGTKKSIKKEKSLRLGEIFPFNYTLFNKKVRNGWKRPGLASYLASLEKTNLDVSVHNTNTKKIEKKENPIRLGDIFPFNYTLFNKKTRNGWQQPGLASYIASLEKTNLDVSVHNTNTKKSIKKEKPIRLGEIFPFRVDLFNKKTRNGWKRPGLAKYLGSLENSNIVGTKKIKKKENSIRLGEIFPFRVDLFNKKTRNGWKRPGLAKCLGSLENSNIVALEKTNLDVSVQSTNNKKIEKNTNRKNITLKSIFPFDFRIFPRCKKICQWQKPGLAAYIASLECSNEKTYYGGGILTRSRSKNQSKNKKDEPEDNTIGTLFPFQDALFEVKDTKTTNNICVPWVTLENINIRETESKHNKKFTVLAKSYKIKLKNKIRNKDGKSNLNMVVSCLSEIIEYGKKAMGFEKDDKINVIIQNNNFYKPYVSTGLLTCNQNTDIIRKLCENVSNILTSDENIDFESCKFQIQVVKIPRGSKNSRRILNLATDCKTKRCIVKIKNTDNLCCPRAIIVGLTYLSNIILDEEFTESQIKSIRSRQKLQKKLALKLCGMLGEYNEDGFTLQDIKNVEQLLDIQIKIICAENFNSVIYQGEEKSRKVNLYKNGNHFDTINSMKAFFGSSYFCEKCNQPLSTDQKKRHVCKNEKKEICLLCMREEHNPSTKKKVFCRDCNRYCYNSECFTEHEFSVCYVVYKCLDCNKICLRENEHRCGFSKCFNCNEIVEISNHKCYMLKKSGKGGRCAQGCRNCAPSSKCIVEDNDNLVKIVKKNYRRLVLKNHPDKGGDKSEFQNVFETFKKLQEIMRNPLTTKCFHNHESEFKTLGVECQGTCNSSKIINNKCTYTEKYIFFDYEARQESGVHIPNLIIAHDFEGNTYHFPNNNSFCSWLISPEHNNYTAIAHYGKGYDSQFIMQYCIQNTVKPYTIYNGTKLMLLEVPSINLKIIDSFNFIQFPLAAFPKTFGLTELKKGYFPHFFNTLENENYVGPLPDKKYYGVETMKEGARKEFLKWYSQKKTENYVFDFKKELYDYCFSDVDILRRSCLEFRKEFLEITNLDPFQYITLPATAMAIFRSTHLQPNTIGVFDFEHKDQYSKSSIAWLNSFENSNIIHAMNGGEEIICGSKVDGFDSTTRTVYQYHGCFWHGCSYCYSEKFVNNVKKMSMEDLLEETKERSNQIKLAGYNLLEVWDCEWKKSPLYKKYKDSANALIEPLQPRDAYFGGRTEVFKTKFTSSEGKVGKYVDIVSLYPTAMFYDKYPIGHPTKIINPNYYDKNWFGLIKCKVLAPKNLYHPVLPTKIKMAKAEKLVFTLCPKCVVLNHRECQHTEENRSFTGTWASVEIEKAIEKGYKILDVYEVWHFESSNSIFKSYIDNFMKIKLETSPHNYSSNEEYLNAVKSEQGFELMLEKIIPNPVKRTIAKLCMNSLYGKFGQRDNMSQTEFVTEPSKFYELLLNEKLTDLNFFLLTEEMIQVNYKYEDIFVKNNYNTNIFLALFTTANARLRLYEKLDEVGKAVIYCDTDSIVYIDDGTNTVKTGNLLGQWTDELDGGYIVKWLATGPKSYYYRTNTGKDCTKVKGFTLHHRNMEKINSIALEKLIDGEIKNVQVTNNQITRDVKTKNLVNKEETKTLSFNFDKRVILENYDTVPYGF
jgi:hypothetical protein